MARFRNFRGKRFALQKVMSETKYFRSDVDKHANKFRAKGYSVVITSERHSPQYTKARKDLPRYWYVWVRKKK